MSRPETGRTGARFGAPARRSRDPEDPADPAPSPAEAPAAETGEAAETTETGETTETVGLTGARFGGRARTTRRQRQAEKERAERASAVPPPDADGSDPTPPEPDDDARPTVELPRITGEPPSEEVGLAESGVAVRPYVLTGGRTRVRAELRIETMVSTVPPGPGVSTETGERRTVLELCDRPRSVSEVAALTRVPLGVARVLIDDLATEGRVRVHLGVDAATGPDVELMNRVLAGLRRL